MNEIKLFFKWFIYIQGIRIQFPRKLLSEVTGKELLAFHILFEVSLCSARVLFCFLLIFECPSALSVWIAVRTVN